MSRKKRRSLLVYLMILAMLCTIFPAAALATEGSSGDTVDPEGTVANVNYSVTVDSGISNGSIAADPTVGAQGDTITVTITPDDGKQLVENSLRYTVDGGVNYAVITTTEGVSSFFMPEADVTITAQFEEIPAVTYSNTTYGVNFNVTGENGSLTAAVDSGPISSGAEVTAGETVVFTAVPDEGYQVKQWTVNSQAAADNKNNTFTVENLAATATITVEFELLPVAVYTVTIDERISGGSVAVDLTSCSADDTIAVTITTDDGKQLVAGSLKYTADGGANYTEISTNEGGYSFVMPAADVTVTAQFEDVSTGSGVWDGSIDVTWYNNTDTVFYIDTPAKLAGLAAIVNGIYNEGATVIGNEGYIVTNVGGGNLAGTTDETWVYGEDDFTGKTVYLTADLDMGGVYDKDNQTWNGPNYMPVGGQYCMTFEDGTTLIGSSWNGNFDGQGHMVKNIYCSRHAGSLGYAFSQSIGLIGRLGVHDNDSLEWYTNPSVKNVAVTGYIYGNRSIGGIVGKSGRSNGSVIENCINYASVNNTDSKGCGGIAGAGWNSLTIKNCANMGEIYTSYSNAGGISGSCEAQVINCYNVGYVGVPEGKESQAQSLGTNNGGAVWTNCYWLDGSSASNEAVYNSTVGSTITKMETAESMKTADFLASLNGDGRAWVADAQNINSGYPILRAWAIDSATVTDITKRSDPDKLNYIAGQIFDPAGLDIWADYNDGTSERITDYTISKTTALEMTDTSIKVSGTVGGKEYDFVFQIKVDANALDSIAITTQPQNVLYAAGECFVPDGMKVRATYTNGSTAILDDSQYIFSPATSLTADVTKVTVSYTEGEITREVGQLITVLASGSPDLEDDFYKLASDDHMLWFANRVNAGLNPAIKGQLIDNIDLSEVTWKPIGNTSSRAYTGVLDGNGKTVTLKIDGSDNYSALFGYVNGATIKNLIVAGSVSGRQYTAGIVANALDAAVIENCVNSASVAAANLYAGGIAGYANNTTVISGCTNNGAISSTSYNVGGIVGYTAATSKVNNSINNGNVSGTYHVGGIVGNDYGTCTISRCANTGTITVDSTAATATCGVGGIVGYAPAATTIDQCYNSGAVSGSIMNVGGVVGYLNNASAKLTNSYNIGSVTSTSTNANANTGGVVGRTNNAACTVQNTYNAGTITASDSSFNIAGVIGYAAGNTNVSNNYYLDTTADKGLGNAADNAVNKTSAELKGLASILGEAFKAGSLYPILAWQTAPDPEAYTVTVAGGITGGSVTVALTSAAAGDTITVTVTPDSGKQFVAGSLKYNDGASDIEITATEGVYSFVMPAADVTVTAQFEDVSTGSAAWDGSVDVTWYNNTDTVFYIDTPAKLAGLAAIVNGIYNKGATVTGDEDYIQATYKESSLTGTSMATTCSGIDDFKDKTVKLTADLDMGGVCAGADWSGPNFMPIGGQYMLDAADENTLLNASFNGVFDGQGHTVKNIYCDRFVDFNYEYSQSIGLIGRLGVHDSDAASLRADSPIIRNVAVSGYIYGRRSVGGIAGKIGKTNNGGIIENCANFATIKGTDSKGTGGIVGAGWNKGYIKDCYNAGAVINDFSDGTGGISGANEVDIYNCYNVGTITGTGNSACAIGHDNSSSNPTIHNCYWLTGSAPGGGYSKSGAKILVTELTADDMKSPAFLADLNGDGRIWVVDTNGINNGYPVLRVQTADTSVFTEITKESDPANLNYVAGQTFDADGLAIWANYSDDTRERITDYTISKADPLETTDSCIVISGEYNGTDYSYEFSVTVVDSALESIAIQTPPINIRYASGEAFDPAGLVVAATYTSGVTAPLDPAAYSLDPEVGTALTPEHTKITVSYTFKGVTKEAEQEITVSAAAAPDKNAEDVYALSTADDMFWFANRVNTGLDKEIKGKLTQDIDLSAEAWTPIGSQNNKYAGAIDGGGHEIALALDGGSDANQGLVGYAADATIKNLTVSGSVTTTGAYAAGFVGRAEGVTIQNCTNKATVNSKGYTAGLLGYSTLNTVTLSDNINEGAITTEVNSIKNHNLGGIAAYISGGSDHLIQNCINKGAVTGASTAGGILGIINASAAITGCINENEAAVNVTGGTAGGIAGYLNHAEVTVTDNHNRAAITSDGSGYLGGIVGRTAQKAYFSQCSNTGTVGAGAYHTGGIVGGSTNAHNLSLCYNTGNVSGVYNIGGIAGNSKAIIADCYNTGQISATAGSANQGAGGIAGTHATSPITNCYSTGAVTKTGNGPAGAMVGRLTSGSINNCYYLEGAAAGGVGSGTGETSSKTEAEMKGAEFVNLIGAAYIIQPNAYPILAWQIEVVATYTVDFDVIGDNGSLTAAVGSEEIGSGAEITAGETVVFTAAPAAGYQVKQWTVDSQVAADNKTNTLIVENLSAVTAVTVEFEALPVSAYTITVDNTITGGSVAVDPVSCSAGDTVTVTVNPAEGKQFVAGSLQYTADDGSTYTPITATEGEGVYSFVLPAADVTVTARFEDVSQAPKYTVKPVEDDGVYTIGSTEDGISFMTVKEGAGGLKYFETQITPVIEHEGKEAVVFTHMHDGAQLSLNITKADFDLLSRAKAGFNVQPGDEVKVYIVDDLTNDPDVNPILLQ